MYYTRILAFRTSCLPLKITSLAYSSNKTKLWEPLRCMLDQWGTGKTKLCCIEVLVPRDQHSKSRVSRSLLTPSKAVFGVRCDRPPPKIVREMAADFRTRTLSRNQSLSL
ncbi:hypothetical protein KM043_009781 [Ampulex compressa]|nr:hypothetical protein KM043_009781 [Ampulex compressa]